MQNVDLKTTKALLKQIFQIVTLEKNGSRGFVVKSSNDYGNEFEKVKKEIEKFK